MQHYYPRDKDKQREEDQSRDQRREERDKRRNGADDEDEQAGGGFQFTGMKLHIIADVYHLNILCSAEKIPDPAPDPT